MDMLSKNTWNEQDTQNDDNVNDIKEEDMQSIRSKYNDE